MRYDDITALLSTPAGEEPSVQVLEDTLTTGYAHALQIEAERLRLERQIAKFASAMRDDSSEPRSEELARLAERVEAAERNLSYLRGLLASLKERVRAARLAQLPATGAG